MALVVFLRGINVGGHRRFRPSAFALELKAYDVVNVGAACTFVVRKPISRVKLESLLRSRLPFVSELVVCTGNELLCLENENPFIAQPLRTDTVRFVSILAKPARSRPKIPLLIPTHGPWFVRLIAVNGRFAFGEYRRDMKTIGYLGQIDKLFGVVTTVRNWNTILAVLRVLRSGEQQR